MQVYQREFARLKSAKSLVKSNFPYFGVNKKREITRLFYEISKREGVSPLRIIKKIRYNGYDILKKNLLQRRYPYAFLNSKSFKPYLPKIELRPLGQANLKERRFYPKHIFIENTASSSFLVRQFKDFFPLSHFSEIKSLKDYKCKHRGFHIEDYNQRKNTVFIVNEGHGFFKRCPCTKGALGCDYHIFNLGFGCIFECTYCYLQEYTNNPGIILPVNIARFFDKFNTYKKRGMRIGTGEFSDSLALDKITGYSIPILEFFRKQRGVIFEFKTKSERIENLLKTNHAGNIVVSWSVNPQKIIDANEYFSASLNARLNSAVKCIHAGYSVGFHFDPVIYFNGWQDEYKSLVENLFHKIKPKHIAWISIGTFRFSRRLKQVIERRFPGNKILNEELLLGYDNKLRYPYAIRYNIYKTLIEMLLKYSRKLNIYLCMGEASMWRDLKLKMPRFS